MFLRWYRTKLRARPYLVQSATTTILFASGDIIAQHGIEERGATGHDIFRTGRMALYGGCVFGPAATAWYGFLSRRVTFRNAPNSFSTICTRVALDQLIFTPVNLACFLTSMAYLEGASPRQRMQTTFWHALKKNWTVWPGVQFANFWAIPSEHRVFFVNVVALGWNSYLSYMNSVSTQTSTKETRQQAGRSKHGECAIQP